MSQPLCIALRATLGAMVLSVLGPHVAEAQFRGAFGLGRLFGGGNRYSPPGHSAGHSPGSAPRQPLIFPSAEDNLRRQPVRRNSLPLPQELLGAWSEDTGVPNLNRLYILKPGDKYDRVEFPPGAASPSRVDEDLPYSYDGRTLVTATGREYAMRLQGDLLTLSDVADATNVRKWTRFEAPRENPPTAANPGAPPIAGQPNTPFTPGGQPPVPFTPNQPNGPPFAQQPGPFTQNPPVGIPFAPPMQPTGTTPPNPFGTNPPVTATPPNPFGTTTLPPNPLPMPAALPAEFVGTWYEDAPTQGNIWVFVVRANNTFDQFEYARGQEAPVGGLRNQPLRYENARLAMARGDGGQVGPYKLTRQTSGGQTFVILANGEESRVWRSKP